MKKIFLFMAAMTLSVSMFAAQEISVAEAATIIAGMEDKAVSADEYVISGVVKKVMDVSMTDKYNNATFSIKDANGSDTILVYRIKYIGGEDWTSQDQVKEGMTVKLQAKLKRFAINGGYIPETQDATLLELDGEEYVEPELQEISVAEAATIIAGMEDKAVSADEYIISGVVKKVMDVSMTDKYNNATFSIKDANGSDTILVYRIKYIGGEDWTSQDQVKEGMTVKLQAKLKRFAINGGYIPETQDATLLELDGEGQGGNEEDNEIVPDYAELVWAAEYEQYLLYLSEYDAEEGIETIVNIWINGTEEEFPTKAELADIDAYYSYVALTDGTDTTYFWLSETEPFSLTINYGEKYETEENGYKLYLQSATISMNAVDDEGNVFVINSVDVDILYDYEESGATGVENIENAASLDLNAPMFNVLGQKVDAQFRGVVIQNGKKYILR